MPTVQADASILPETVVVFGASGFVGRNLIRRLTGRVGRLVAVSPGGVALDGAEGVRMKDLDHLSIGSDAIAVHLAAHRYDAANVRAAQSDMLVKNVQICGRVFEFCVRQGISELRMASSNAVYDSSVVELDDEPPFDASRDPYDSEKMYGWSKRIGEIYARLYCEMYGINSIVFRLTNPYGPFDSTDEAKAHVVSAFVIRALTTQGPFTVRGNPEATRDFIYVDDICAAFEASLRKHRLQAVYNLGTGSNTSIRTLAETILRLIGTPRPLVSVGGGTSDVVHRYHRVDRVKADLGLSGFTPLDDGLATTIQWYRHALAR